MTLEIDPEEYKIRGEKRLFQAYVVSFPPTKCIYP